jgi:general secretion pathway protein K
MRSGKRPGDRQTERGFALVIVLWMMGLLAVLAMAFAGDARTQLLIARNQHENARARALADAGISLALLGVLDHSAEIRWRVDGETREIPFADGTIRISIQDEAGKVDLNVAPKPLLAGILQATGATQDEALQLVDAIFDWKAQRVAEWTASGTEGRLQPFLAIEELRLVPGMTPEIVQRVLRFVTVHSRRSRIDPFSAPAEVLRSIPGIKPDELDAFLEARRRRGAASGLPPLTGISAFIAQGGRQIMTLRAEGITANGARSIREAVIALARGASPYTILAWR